MNRLNQVNMSQTIRRFGLPQAALLTGAFATAVLLALLFRPARIPTVELVQAPPITAPQKPLLRAEAERDAAQAKLAAAMARFATPPTKETEPPAPAQSPAPIVETPTPMARLAEPQILPPQVTVAPAPAAAMRPITPPLSDADLRRLGDKAAQALRDGDIYGARLILERAIEGGDANALMALADTYDPRGLARMNAKGVKPDPARARDLYMQATEKGVTAAKARLDALGQ